LLSPTGTVHSPTAKSAHFERNIEVADSNIAVANRKLAVAGRKIPFPDRYSLISNMQ
jgi:hypothetical protein